MTERQVVLPPELWLAWRAAKLAATKRRYIVLPIADAVDDVTLRTRDDARHYLAALPEQRARWSQWQAAARERERVTCCRAVE